MNDDWPRIRTDVDDDRPARPDEVEYCELCGRPVLEGCLTRHSDISYCEECLEEEEAARELAECMDCDDYPFGDLIYDGPIGGKEPRQEPSWGSLFIRASVFGAVAALVAFGLLLLFL